MSTKKYCNPLKHKYFLKTQQFFSNKQSPTNHKLNTMNLYPILYRTLAPLIPPETAHHLTLTLLSKPNLTTLITRLNQNTNFHYAPQTHWGLHFPNPIGLAAGLDKNALALPAWQALGFGFIEIGTITPLPQPGNPPPRLFRIPKQRALINHMGFPNHGAHTIAHRLHTLKKLGHRPTIPIGINIGKNKDTPLEKAPHDYAKAAQILHPHADYFTLNISSPNTPGLRILQTPQTIAEIITAVRHHTDRPLLIKLAPDLDHPTLLSILDTCAKAPIQGLILTNTLPSSPPPHSPSKPKGGISGPPLHQHALALVRVAAAHLAHTPLKIIGVGGIENLTTLQSFIHAGAHLVQLYTGLIYHGPALLRHFAKNCHLIHSTRPL
jgi:dihydroorotate dehydrogenase